MPQKPLPRRCCVLSRLFESKTRLKGWHKLTRPRQPETLPVRIFRRRLYIIPTAYGCFLGLMLQAILMGALNNSNNAGILFATVAAAVLVIGIIATHQQLHGVRVVGVHAFPAFAGDPITVRITLDSRSKRARRGLVVTWHGVQTTVNVMPSEMAHVDVILPGMDRGVHAMERFTLSTRQPFGIARAWAWVWPESTLMVYPALETLSPDPPGQAGVASGRSAQATRIGQDVHHLREYQPGDAMRDVAWKASARSGRLISRTYEPPHGGDLKLRWEDVQDLPWEQRLSRLATWVVTADTQGRPTALALPGWSTGPSQGLPHRHTCLQALARMPRG